MSDTETIYARALARVQARVWSLDPAGYGKGHDLSVIAVKADIDKIIASEFRRAIAEDSAASREREEGVADVRRGREDAVDNESAADALCESLRQSLDRFGLLGSRPVRKLHALSGDGQNCRQHDRLTERIDILRELPGLLDVPGQPERDLRVKVGLCDLALKRPEVAKNLGQVNRRTHRRDTGQLDHVCKGGEEPEVWCRDDLVKLLRLPRMLRKEDRFIPSRDGGAEVGHVAPHRLQRIQAVLDLDQVFNRRSHLTPERRVLGVVGTVVDEPPPLHGRVARFAPRLEDVRQFARWIRHALSVVAATAAVPQIGARACGAAL